MKQGAPHEPGRTQPPNLPDEVAGLADRLYLTVVHLMRRIRRADDQLGLSAAQLSVITRLAATGSMTLGELAAAEGVRPPSMTRLVQRLEEGGYVIRRPDPKDKRVVRIAYTSLGFAALEAGRATRVAAFGERLAALSDGDLGKLSAALGVLDELSR